MSFQHRLRRLAHRNELPQLGLDLAFWVAGQNVKLAIFLWIGSRRGLRVRRQWAIPALK
jgi:hypothetical protein